MRAKVEQQLRTILTSHMALKFLSEEHQEHGLSLPRAAGDPETPYISGKPRLVGRILLDPFACTLSSSAFLGLDTFTVYDRVGEKQSVSAGVNSVSPP